MRRRAMWVLLGWLSLGLVAANVRSTSVLSAPESGPKTIAPWLAGTALSFDTDRGKAPSTPHYRVDLRIETTSGHKLSAPPSFVAAGQVATLTAQRSTSFVRDVDIEVQGTSFIADPIIGVLADGIHVELAAAPTASSDKRSWLAVRTTLVHLRKPFPQRSIRCAKNTTPSVVQLPQVATEHLGKTLRVREGQATLVARLPTPDEATTVSIWATVSRVGAVAFPAFAPDPPSSSDPSAKDEDSMVNALLPARALPSLLRDAIAGTDRQESLHIQLVEVDAEMKLTGPIHESRAKAWIDAGGNTLNTFTLTPLHVAGTTAHALAQRSYVQDYDPAGPTRVVKSEEGERKLSTLGVYDPAIGSQRDGRAVTLVRTDAGLALRVLWSELVSPVEQFEVELDPGFGVTIDLPELRLIQAHINLSSGHVKELMGSTRTPENGFDLRKGRYLIPLVRVMTPQGVSTRAVWLEIKETPRSSALPK